MKIAVIGLGLIGGSVAKACKNAGNEVYGLDRELSVVLKAKLVSAIDAEIKAEELSRVELIIIALYKGDTIEFIKQNSKHFAPNAIVLDCTGTKRSVCSEIDGFAEKNGFYFIGAHPMAGREFSGFEYSRDNLFDNASIILTPSKNIPIEILARIKKLCQNMGFAEVVITTPDNHDKMIAFTSQLAHVVSNAYIKSPTAAKRGGFSAGSYKDLTRVARLNVDMWSELFLDNRDNLITEIEILEKNLSDIKRTLIDNDEVTLKKLLEFGVQCKEIADKTDDKS